MDDLQIVWCTVPDAETGRNIADQLVEYGLAACVNLIPGVESIYRWEGETRHDNESLLMIKTTSKCYEKLQEVILELHPYELPEIIAVPLTSGLSGYLDWLKNSCKEAK